MKFIEQIQSTADNLSRIEGALRNYELALNKAFPDGAPNDVWQHWSLARSYLFEPAPKKEGLK